jgi:hypothetical protein
MSWKVGPQILERKQRLWRILLPLVGTEWYLVVAFLYLGQHCLHLSQKPSDAAPKLSHPRR